MLGMMCAVRLCFPRQIPRPPHYRPADDPAEQAQQHTVGRPVIGEKVSHYEITRKLGAGGMGIVYAANDSRLGRSVAIKFLPEDCASNAVARGRFEREAQTASSLNHPNICTIFDIGEHKGQPFLVMELLNGKTLREVIGGRSLKIDNLIELGAEVADALDAAHSSNIIHRDIKSTNIFVDNRGHARLLDFGLAKLVRDPQLEVGDWMAPTQNYTEEVHTGTGAVLGTMKYMAPEQARGEEVDVRADLFSLGVVLYEMATGKTPFGGRTIAVTFDEILNKDPEPCSKLNSSVPSDLDTLISRAMAKSVEERYQSARELLADLKRVGSSPTFVPPPSVVDVDRMDETISVSSRLVDTASDAPPSSIAVLPFVNLSGNPENDYFGDGLAEDLITTLMRIEGVHVAARTSTFQYKGQSLDVREIGRQLGVATVLEGSFRIVGNRIRVTANYIDVNDGYQLWSDRLDRDMDDIFELQDEMTKTIVAALELTLGGQSRSQVVVRPTQDAEAYNHYLRGRYHWKKRSPADIHKAVASFREALDIDPDYALAHAGLADCYVMLSTYAVMPRRVVMPQAKEAAKRAMELDGTIAEAHAALGMVAAMHDFQWNEAERHFEDALHLAPDHATARYWYALFVLLPCGRFDEALGQANWAAQLDPVNPSIAAASAMVHYMQRDYPRARESLRSALDLDPDHPLSNITLGWVETIDARFDEAINAFEHCKAMRVVVSGGFAWAHLRAGNRDEAQAHLAQLEEMSRQGNAQADFEMVRYFAATGDLDRAFECLDRTIDERAGTVFWLNVNPAYDALKSDSRFAGVLARLNLGPESSN